MDTVFRVMPQGCFQHDECRIRNADAPANFATVEHACPGPRSGVASNLPRRTPGNNSRRVKRKLAAWDATSPPS